MTLIRPHHIFTFLLKWQTSSYILPSSIQYGHHSLENRAWWGCKLTEVFSNGKIWVDFTIPIRPSPLPLTPQFCVFMPRSTVSSCLLKGTRGKCSGYMAPQTYETIYNILLMLANIKLWWMLCARQICILMYFNVAFVLLMVYNAPKLNLSRAASVISVQTGSFRSRIANVNQQSATRCQIMRQWSFFCSSWGRAVVRHSGCW